jgi:hypothetical protein
MMGPWCAICQVGEVQVLAAIQRSRLSLDDDQIASAVAMNRHYVNQICRQLAREGLISRSLGPNTKLVNMIDTQGDQLPGTTGTAQPVAVSPHRRGSRGGRMESNIERLVEGFESFVSVFEERPAFPGPSLYFHDKALARRRCHASVEEALDDERFLEYVYAVLPAWGMHRMGRQAAKVSDFAPIVAALREARPALEELWPRRITEVSPDEVGEVAQTAWDVISQIKVSTSRTQIVAGSKFLHHMLPDLVPPIDRQYTFTFFTGQRYVTNDRLAFLDWFPRLAQIGARCREPIRDAICRGGIMATSEAKVIDNAIMGFSRH